MIDLHTHSTYSDGSDSPARLVELAVEAGCSVMALTDHDTVRGVPEARARALELGIEMIAGVELSCRCTDINVHILGYFLDTDDPVLQDRLKLQREIRNARNARLLERLNNLGLNITMDEVMAQAGDESVGRPHFAAALMARRMVSTINEAFVLYLGEGTPGFVERAELTSGDGIAWIKEAGGLAVWAHPYSRSPKAAADLEPEIGILVEAGLDGIEALYSRYNKETQDQLRKVANKYDLVITGGSDYHGTYKTDLVVGRGEGKLAIGDDIYDALLSRAKAQESAKHLL